MEGKLPSLNVIYGTSKKPRDFLVTQVGVFCPILFTDAPVCGKRENGYL